MHIHPSSNDYQLVCLFDSPEYQRGKQCHFPFIIRKLRQRAHEKFAQGQSLSTTKLNVCGGREEQSNIETQRKLTSVLYH